MDGYKHITVKFLTCVEVTTSHNVDVFEENTLPC